MYGKSTKSAMVNEFLEYNKFYGVKSDSKNEDGKPT